jgi:hypothetical protein
MTISIHDSQLVSYEVECERRLITLRTEYRRDNQPTEFTNVVLEGVVAYHFEDDAFGNIIFDLTEVPIPQFLEEYGAKVSELHRMTGSPSWAKELTSAPKLMTDQGIRPFILSASLGLSGWILAKELILVRVGPPDSESSAG